MASNPAEFPVYSLLNRDLGRETGSPISLLVALVLTTIWIGYLLLFVLLAYSMVMVLVAASHASKRELYTYPVALRVMQ